MDLATRQQKLRNAGFSQKQIPIIDSLQQTVQIADVANPAAIVTTQTAGTTYVAGTTDTMINNLKTDVTNLRTTLNSLMVNMKASGILL